MVNLDAPKRKERRANRWVTWVKKYSIENGMKYHEALKSPQCKSQYHMNKIVILKKNASSVEYENPCNKKNKKNIIKRLFSCVSV